MTSDNDNLGAIMGSTTTVRTMADGTLRLTVDIEPRHARAAFTLFGAPGTPVAMARMTPEAAVAQDRRALQRDPSPPAKEQKGGQLCKLAAIFCSSDEFRMFLADTLSRAPDEIADPAEIIRTTCGVTSRAELDHNDRAAQIFHNTFRLPYQAWLHGRRG